MTYGIKKISLLIAFLVPAMHCIHAQEIEKNDLFKTWYLEKYREDYSYYEPPTKEKSDYILLKEDMTFVSKSEGEIEKGTWMLNTNGSYIEIKDDTGEKEKIFILYSTSKTLVVLYDIDGIREMEVHYVSCM
ncbi:MAG: hypothetical protein WBG90_03565 [Saonia sp.]